MTLFVAEQLHTLKNAAAAHDGTCLLVSVPITDYNVAMHQ